jgi:Xaa-Pro aminopeptidase
MEESSIPNITAIRSIREIPEQLRAHYGTLPRTLAFELDVIPVQEFRFYQRLFPGQICVDGSPLIHRVRMLKSEWELAQLEKTAELSRQTFTFMRENLRPGYTEMEFAGLFEAFARKIGHAGRVRVRDYQTEGYPWHVLSGTEGAQVGVLDSPASGEGTSAAFPCGAGGKKIARNEPIMVDFTFVHNGYHIDETRMFAIGRMPGKAMRACRAAIEIHNDLLERVRPGLPLRDLYERSVAKAETMGYADAFLGTPGYKVTFVGHGIGLELIEHPIIAPNRETLLEPGMVFALEPKLLFEHAFTAGIESVFTVTERGARLISKVPVDLFIV